MQNLNLRMLESKTWRANQQDGLFDLFFGALFLGIALSQLADGLWGNDAVTLAVLICTQFGGALGLWLARRAFTQPRIGVVRFGALRKRRIRTTSIVLSFCVAATVALVVLTALSERGVSFLSGPVSRYTVSAVAAGLILIPLAAIAYFQEFPRILVHAMLFLGAEFGGTWLERQASVPFPHAVTFGVASLVSAGVGMTLLIRFLRVPPEQSSPGTPGEPDHA
ncbi:MAG: hypothetical protein NTX69_06760 [Candidatus Bipolaricaulota bacterium]|nr:hypothetical protein [Candidatus Bipolaricaulota bacterium]